MGKSATVVELSEEDRAVLEGWVRASTTEQRLVQRGRIVLAAAAGTPTEHIARRYGVRAATVSKWRTRFAARGLAALQDAPRPGRARRYDAEVERRVLAALDQKPPAGRAKWTARLLARALGDVPRHHIWRILRSHGIHLQRRHSWCVSTDPQFAPKAADIVGLYLNPPEGAVVLSVDEKPHIQVLERAQGYLKLPNGRAITGFSHEYTRHGTTTLFAALNVLTGQLAVGKHTKRRRRIEFLDFMNDVVRLYPAQEIHVILDNLSTHKPKHDRWLARHPNVHFHFTPTHASWLNQIECWFSILVRGALSGASFISPQQLRQAINDFIAGYNQDAVAFHWTKATVHQVQPKHTYAELRC
jgi:transposase